jgi:alpha-ketoglutarate-dependent taurine dioxygenase
MKTRALKNYDSSLGVEAHDIDWNNPAEIQELGRLVATQCIVFVDQRISTELLSDTMTAWGDPAHAIIHNYVTSRQLAGRHWREIYLNLGYTVSELDKKMHSNVSTVTYKKDDQGRAQGIFSNGELDWHSDQCAFDDAPRTIGLQSVSDTANSQTTFLCTHDAYESLSSDMRSMVHELVVKHKWYEGRMAPGLNKVQSLLIRYNMVPLDGMETRLYSETTAGVPGLKIPSHSFDGFVGMSWEESLKVLEQLRKIVFQDRWVYTQNWQDGQVVFMDQEITLHARPTNIQHGDKRQMARCITYMNKLYPDVPRRTNVRWQGREIPHDQFAEMVDLDRARIFEIEQQGEYI